MLQSKYGVSIDMLHPYQQVGEEDGHENKKDHPQYVGDFWKWNRWNVTVWSPGSLVKNVFISHLSSGHGHGFPSRLKHVDKWWTLKERVKVVEGHVECKGEHHNECDSQDHCPNKCLEYALEHENIETSVYMERRILLVLSVLLPQSTMHNSRKFSQIGQKQEKLLCHYMQH